MEAEAEYVEAVDENGNFVYDLGETIEISLPTKGTTIQVGSKAAEVKLVELMTLVSLRLL